MSEFEPEVTIDGPHAPVWENGSSHEKLCCPFESARVDLDHNAWAAESSNRLTIPEAPRGDSARAVGHVVVESSTSSVSSESLNQPPTDPTEDDEEFGDFQEASSDPFAQPIFVADDWDESDACLPNAELQQEHGLFEGLGLVEPIYARFDETSRELRRAGKLWLRMLRLGREEVGLNNVTALSCGRRADQPVEANDLNDKASNHQMSPMEEDMEASASCPLDLNGTLRPVTFVCPRIRDAQQEMAKEMGNMVEAERQAWAQ
ncbi:hypothetical protein FB567DRAFT_619158 [Paraphoma chrysanthemicola]|uniref:Uncharacterized protein n=1 Tax=Paraphoma chrysanthemicola TaxID=798071 RepID=A0A8K0W0P7_9PLEO|nr:hypothetical protein FB567DRAFT_619158 [Paraphoma chrysanthemicola]